MKHPPPTPPNAAPPFLRDRMAALRQGRGSIETFIIAIDGRCAAGKTSLASALAREFGAGVVHMDDFFLPGELRTEARLAQPGGNVHYERFISEVLPHLKSGEAFSYRAFDCAEMRLGGLRQATGSRWRIVEGAYSHHPELGGYMDLRVFCDIKPEEQLQRIRTRNGETALATFKSKWIPLEEAYLAAFDIKGKADIILAGDS
ncbi:MAG: uridine kinase [Oscillospiraceae bacterium]|nr:uridine kinase [Oscillospiraceae bacterium]